MSKKKTHEEYVAELAIKNPDVEAVEQYINAKTPILHHCLLHNILWRISPNGALQGYGCAVCKKEKNSIKMRKSHQQYVNEVASVNQDVDVVGQYVNVNTPIAHRCKIHDFVWNTTPAVILQGCGCPLCWREKLSAGRLKGHTDYVAEVELMHPNIEVVEKYINARTKILHRCKVDGYQWMAQPDSVLSGCGCPKCAGNLKKTTDSYIKEVNDVNANIEVLEEYINAKTPILHKCKIDGYKWLAQPTNVLTGYGCPQCNESHGEKSVCRWLDMHRIEYIMQHRFSECRNKQPLPFDFYLPSFNICIEYDGEQHFRPVDFFGGVEKFTQRQRNDEIKTKYCEGNNIRLLRIPYYKNIEEELESFLFI